MSNRDFDFIIFGATGFTGKFVVQEVKKISKNKHVTWAVAGRNHEKLNGVVSELLCANDAIPEIIIADVNDYQSLLLMCKRGKVILDCVGPYRFFGEQVVKACVEAETNYVDICGEPQFLENMQLKYNDGAEKGNIYIVGACGFDSIPSDIGANFARQQFDGTLNSIKSYLEIFSGSSGLGLHFATYESAVNGFGDVTSLQKIRKAFGHKPLPLVGKKLKSDGAVCYHNSLKKYAIPFLGADNSVVRRSQRYIYESLNEPPTQYMMYSCIGGAWSLFLMIFFGSIFKLLASYSWGRKLLLNFPKVFTAGLCSHEGPTKKQLDETSFSLTMYCDGYSDGASKFNRIDPPDKKIVVKVSGPEPGYVATPIMMVQSALAILKEAENLPQRGGVYAPGAMFYKTDIIKHLQESGIKFEVINM